MSFATQQQRARHSTRWLIVMLALAVAGMVAAVYTVAGLALAIGTDRGSMAWNANVFALAAAGTLLVVGGGSVAKIAQLRAGGPAIASMLDARPLQPNTDDHRERVLRNVVEEMAVASGIAVPSIYVLDDEAGINAFAAGFGPSDAVVGVTRGALAQLDRDELQGVVAHEFSHILNGDMRLNSRLIGLLHGILCVALAGQVILRSGTRQQLVRRGKGNANASLFALGVGLLGIGWIGLLCARLIQAAVARQREFLADAAAVQFTRNPAGISNALRKIAGLAAGSQLQTAQAMATSHLFFGNALRASWLRAFATHPPLSERIRRLDPSHPYEPGFATATRPLPSLATGVAAATQPRRAGLTPEQLVTSVGELDAAAIEHARDMLRDLPLPIAAALHEPCDAPALVLALLLSRDATARRAQLDALRAVAPTATCHAAATLAPAVAALAPELRLPVVDAAIPALRAMSPAQHGVFAVMMRTLIDADAEIELFELVLGRVLGRHLRHHFTSAPQQRLRQHALHALAGEIQLTLSCLARAGHRDIKATAAAYMAAQRSLPAHGDPRPLLAASHCDFAALDLALDKLAAATPTGKLAVLRACATAVANDGLVATAEAELLRAIADALDCPIVLPAPSPP